MNTQRTRRVGDVTVTEFIPDWNDLAWSTTTLLGAEGGNPGLPEAIVNRFYGAMASPNELGTRFVNPRFVVTGRGPTAEFIRAARRAQITWFKDVKAVFGKAGLAKQEIERPDPITRQLCFTGVMIIQGKYFPPGVWWERYGNLAKRKRNTKKQKRRSTPRQLTGQRFGKLTVVNRHERGSWWCLCDCGQEKPIRGCHLRAGRTKSCGCLRIANQQKPGAR